jgi:hypothetical protein
LLGIAQFDLPSLVPNLFWPSDQWSVPTLRASLGCEVAVVSMVNCWDAGEGAPLDGELEFGFHGGQVIRVTTTHMAGVEVLPTSAHEEPRVTGDECDWHWLRRELSVEAPWLTLVGARLVSVAALIKPDIGYGFDAGVTGLLFDFGSNRRVGYDNWNYDQPRASFNPSAGVWSDGRVIEWMRCTAPNEEELPHTSFIGEVHDAGPPR